MESKQLGVVRLFTAFRVKEPDDEYVLQLLHMSDKGCTFVKSWQDRGESYQGVLKLDSNEIFGVDPEILKLEPLEIVPAWMQDCYIDPEKYI